MGVGHDDADRNPFLQAEIPTLRDLLDGPVPTLAEPERAGPRAVAFPLDATLGVSGTPRSGTGQTALLTGHNAAELHGAHFGPWAPVALRPLLADENLLRRAADGGLRVAFANAYPRGYRDRVSPRSVAPVTLAADAAGLLVRHREALGRGDAIATEILNDGWRKRIGAAVPEIRPEDAGRNLARIAADHDLTLFAHYGTDHAGHRRSEEAAVSALVRIDRFLRGVVEALDPEACLLVASDHGNIEDLRTQHTRNPALGLLAGSGAVRRRHEIHDIRDVAPAVVRWLGGDPGPSPHPSARARPPP